jgi:hypothetical protein
MLRHRHARVLLAIVTLALAASLSAAPAVAHGGSPVLLAGPERCC